jgi:uncharacterized protein YdeI (YjbR/CyaY-like superfamily)
MDDTADLSRMKRDIHPMPDDVLAALRERGLVEAYRARPPYQQNDYIGWIGRARRGDTRERRIAQMLDELQAGGVYMKMKWNGGAR